MSLSLLRLLRFAKKLANIYAENRSYRCQCLGRRRVVAAQEPADVTLVGLELPGKLGLRPAFGLGEPAAVHRKNSSNIVRFHASNIPGVVAGDNYFGIFQE